MSGGAKSYRPCKEDRPDPPLRVITDARNLSGSKVCQITFQSSSNQDIHVYLYGHNRHSVNVHVQISSDKDEILIRRQNDTTWRREITETNMSVAKDSGDSLNLETTQRSNSPNQFDDDLIIDVWYSNGELDEDVFKLRATWWGCLKPTLKLDP